MTKPPHRACLSNACRQGRIACPTPQACRLPLLDDDDVWEPAPLGEVLVEFFWPLAAVAAVAAGLIYAVFFMPALFFSPI